MSHMRLQGQILQFVTAFRQNQSLQAIHLTDQYYTIDTL